MSFPKKGSWHAALSGTKTCRTAERIVAASCTQCENERHSLHEGDVSVRHSCLRHEVRVVQLEGGRS